MLCDECFADGEQLELVHQSLLQSGRVVIPISLIQVRFFCGNALELRGGTEEEPRFIVALSVNAWENLFDWQKEILEEHVDEIVPIPAHTIEKIGGGSVRCMIGQLFIN